VRLFVAIYPPSEVVRHLKNRLGDPGVRLTPADRWHITLHFLGEVPDGRLPGIERALDTVPRTGKPTLRVSGGGAFGRGRRTVLWAGIDGDLQPLHDGITDALGADRSPLTAHLTLAYAASEAVREALDGYVGPPWTANEFMLVRSHHGGGYQTLRAWPL
jgi:2'-5' RNA ligase